MDGTLLRVIIQGRVVSFLFAIGFKQQIEVVTLVELNSREEFVDVKFLSAVLVVEVRAFLLEHFKFSLQNCLIFIQFQKSGLAD